MDELEIKIVLHYKVPEKGLTLNGILRGLEQDKDILMGSMVKAILHALEEKAMEEQKIREPVEQQGPRGESLGKTEMRWAFACEDVGKRFEPVGFWVGEEWGAIHKDLGKRLDYGKLQVLFSDGAPGIEENLLSEGMRKQRCIWHGKRDFAILLYQDGLKKEEQKPFRKLMAEILLFSLTKELLEEVLPPEKELVEEIKRGFEKLIKALSPEKYPKSRAYMENFYQNALLVFDFWLKGMG